MSIPNFIWNINWDKLLRERAGKLDQTFFMVIKTNLNRAQNLHLFSLLKFEIPSSGSKVGHVEMYAPRMISESSTPDAQIAKNY